MKQKNATSVLGSPPYSDGIFLLLNCALTRFRPLVPTPTNSAVTKQQCSNELIIGKMAPKQLIVLTVSKK